MEWVLAVEHGYVALATGGAEHWHESPDRLAAASGAIASHFLAVASPRSFSLIVDDASQHDVAALSLEAHRTWFQPRDIRCTDAVLAARTGGRTVALAEALAADIVCVHANTIAIAASALRRGTHVNVLGDPRCLDAELLALATVIDAAGLPALAAGIVDGRQLDELTVFRYG